MKDLSNGCEVSVLEWLSRRKVYTEQPPRYVHKGKENKVYRLKKASYGLKQAPWAWNTSVDDYFQKNGFINSPYEHSHYTKNKFSRRYHDSMLIRGPYDLYRKQPSMFKGIFISQKQYAGQILRKFRMEEYKRVSIPAEVRIKLRVDSTTESVNSTLFRCW